MSIAHTVYRILLKAYGPQGWWPMLRRAGTPGFDSHGYHRGDYSYPKSDADQFEIAVGAILTQGTAWKNVETALLCMLGRKIVSREAISMLPEKELARCIRSSGYHNQKAKKLKAFVAYRGEITMQGFLSVWGIGPETADSIVLYAYSQSFFVVDAYTRRIFSRIGLIREKDRYDSIQAFFQKNLPGKIDLYQEYHALIVEHAKQHCRVKPLCKSCPLLPLCALGKSLTHSEHP